MSKNLIIYKSSAGSGKTYTLVREYLRIILNNPEDFKHTLAVTFTNKAAEEMKNRIIEKLTELSAGKDGELEKKLKADGVSGDIPKKAGASLKEILHRYSNFSVQTIDSFFHRVIRSFAKELKLQLGYGIEVEIDDVLNVVVDKMLDRIGTDEELTGHIESFVFNTIDDDKSWKIDRLIKVLSKEVVSERFWEIKDEFGDPVKIKKDIQGISEELYGITGEFEENMMKFSMNASAILQKHGLSVDDFHYKKSGFMGWLVNNIMEREFMVGERVREAYDDPEKIFTKKFHPNLKKAISGGLIDEFKKAVDHFDSNFRKYNTAKVILRTIYIQGIFSDILDMLVTYRDENRVLLISDLNIVLQKIITGCSSPFIYEKVGTYYGNFLVDEFQDTSNFQWKNIHPLIENSLSEKNFSVIVGDVKQSIYRWRGGNMKLLKDKVYDDLDSHREMIEDRTLTENFRSRKEIVKFNNAFFKEAPGLIAMNEETAEMKNFIKDSYSDTGQSLSRCSEGGYVRIDCVKADKENNLTKAEAVNLKFLEFVEELIKDGYSQKDITVLVRFRKDATAIASLLLENGYDVISEESQLLYNSPAVKLIISALKYIADSKNYLARTEILFQYLEYLKKNKTDPGKIFTDHTGKNGSLFFDELPRDFFRKEKDSAGINPAINSLNLYELTEKLISIFELNKNPDAYILRFLDLSLEYMIENSSDITGFVEWWEETKTAHTIILPDQVNAISVLTIHKAKGLQNKAVIIPHANWNLEFGQKDMIWASANQKPFNRLPFYLVRAKDKLEESYFKEEYRRQLMLTRLDNLNLLYVAFTRAQERLYVIANESDSNSKKNSEQVKNVSGLVNTVIRSEAFPAQFNLKENKFEAGVKEKNAGDKNGKKSKTKGSIKLDGMVSSDYHSRLVIRPSHREIKLSGFRGLYEKANRGIVLHEALSRISGIADVEIAVGRMVTEGFITNDPVDALKKDLNDILGIELMKEWFSGEWEVKSESEILLDDGTVIRPDRVMIKGSEAVVLDYKTGIRQKEHKKQLDTYADALLKMGYEKVSRFILYTREKELVEI